MNKKRENRNCGKPKKLTNKKNEQTEDSFGVQKEKPKVDRQRDLGYIEED